MDNNQTKRLKYSGDSILRRYEPESPENIMLRKLKAACAPEEKPKKPPPDMQKCTGGE